MSVRGRHFGSRRGSVATEFAMVLPLLIILLFGIIDVGRMMWTWNRAEKATQMGVRFAAVTDMADAVDDADPANDSGLWTYDFYTAEGIPRGDPIPDSSFTSATCTSSGCTCVPATLPCGGIADGFNNTVARMQLFMPEIQPSNVIIEYGRSGIGYSGDPYGFDVNPLITVRLTGVNFHPMLGWVFGASMTLPQFASTLSMEDGTGAISN